MPKVRRRGKRSEEQNLSQLSPLWQKFSEVFASLPTDWNTIAPVSMASMAPLLFWLQQQSRSHAVWLHVVPEEKTARRLHTEISWYATEAEQNNESEILFFPAHGALPFSYARPDVEREGWRTRALATLAQKKKCLLITSVEALSGRVVAPGQFHDLAFHLRSGEDVILAELISYLGRMGYERVALVEKPGDFSVKGSLVDIFCPAYFNPIRLDFFGDELESIRFFDPLTQKSIGNEQRLSLYPRREILVTDAEIEILEKEFVRAGHELHPPPLLTSRGGDVGGLFDVFPFFVETASLLDYLGQEFDFSVYDREGCLRRMEQLEQERHFLYEKNAGKFVADPDKLFFSASAIAAMLDRACRNMYPVSRSVDDIRLPLYEPAEFRGRFSQVVEFLESAECRDKEIFLSCTSEAQSERLRHIFEAYKDVSIRPNYLLSPLAAGVFAENFLLLTEHEIFGKTARVGNISKTTSQVIESFVDLKEGDIVVHVNYGLARFVCLKRMRVAGFERDFLELEFAGKDRLYVPLEQLNLVHRYIGSTENPRLDFLGKKSAWEKTKERVKQSVQKLAFELLELYAKREQARGFAFPADSVFQEEFEASFPYEETDHQLNAIVEVKRDMESEKPMDRLVCGDVGFGKTEVAIRAAFKAVMAGKQVAVLCPTTILAFQHYQTFKERFRNYPVTIDYISRFKSPQEIRDIKENLAIGKIDIIIGTHVLLAKSISFRNLGLLVIDEEQRFGVAHKEAIKNIKYNVDCLTMTATPIPRTLHMSLVGIRDLSLIETPPRNRQKIETYVIEEDEEILKAALRHELERGGQVYVLHNKVKTIEAQAARLSMLLPKARIAVLHGQMPEEQIETTMLDFYRQVYDILVATTIIESGIDIPNVNTLVVMNAQDFGLSQLYQIKGRVGRSDRQAYAYFFYPAKMVLNEVAQKRLNTLQEYDELGAGFKIAMKDLEIRGAGNILGAEQSGDIMAVGFELYVQMLQEKIAELRAEKKEPVPDCVVNIHQNFFFPDSYISDTRQKMEFYKKLASATSLEEIAAVAQQLEDRFGGYPAQVEAMILQEKIRVLGHQLRLERIDTEESGFSFTISASTKIAVERLMKLIQKDDRFTIDKADPRKVLFVPRSAGLSDRLREFTGILEYII